MPQARKITIESRAKLNLFLKVYNTRPDGFHNIQSIFQTVDLADSLKFSLEKGRSGIHIRTIHKELPLGDDNLIVKAFNKIAKKKEPPSGEGILCEVTKKIPIGAGLGGGSSNCAATLTALNSLLGANLDNKALNQMGAELGSDVSFFFTAGTCIVHGRGEKIEMLPEISKGGFLISVPPVVVDTALAYRILDVYRANHGISVSEVPDHRVVMDLWSSMILNDNFSSYIYNDFEKAILGHYPLIEETKKRFDNVVGTSFMTGSGSALFAYFPEYDSAWKALERYEPLPGEFLGIARPVREGHIIHA